MILQVNIKQIGSRKKIAPVPFEYPQNPTTVRELIEETVKICVDEYNKRVQAGDSQVKPLTSTEIADKAKVGKIAFGINYSEKEQDLSKALSNAIQSFEDGLYRIFLGETELENLDSDINLKENDVLTFIRLTMLSGRIW